MARPWTVVVPKPEPEIEKAAVEVVATEVADEEDGRTLETMER